MAIELILILLSPMQRKRHLAICGLSNWGTSRTVQHPHRYLLISSLGLLANSSTHLVYLLQSKPDAVSPWNASQEGVDAADWAQGFINVWKYPLPMLTAGSYAETFSDYPEWPNTDYLINTAYNETVKDAVKVYVGHLYAAPPGNNTLATEMNHAKTVSDLAVFADRVATAASVNRSFILGTPFISIR
jgi:hypothetical protein